MIPGNEHEYEHEHEEHGVGRIVQFEIRPLLGQRYAVEIRMIRSIDADLLSVHSIWFNSFHPRSWLYSDRREDAST